MLDLRVISVEMREENIESITLLEAFCMNGFIQCSPQTGS